jgi:hypothetical protein
MKKNDVYFTLILLFIVKLILLPTAFPDAAVLLVLLAYRPVTAFLKLKEKREMLLTVDEKFAKVAEEVNSVKATLESLKVKENILQSFGKK